MGSLGGVEVVARNKAMWVYPKMMGANPSERWGHSACYFNGLVYIFGGCRGGVHFSDVLVCNLGTMRWSILKTSGQGQGPGPRDSHSAVVVGHKMIVFGGTNGCKKVNDLHILDLLSREWTHPECHGVPPCARESHTANVVSDNKLVIFGGSGEGEGNYLNDLHVLDLKTMEWSSPEVKGSVPAPRDSHSSVAVGNRLFVFGGDSGDRYQGDVCVLDMNNLVWSKLDNHGGSSPPARAGHAAVSIGTKVYVLGGVGDKQYYSDIWVLDIIKSSWIQLTQISQPRFSHTATVTNLGIAVFGGCGDDERPLNELVILQTDSLTCAAFGNTYKEEETKMLLRKADSNTHKTIFIGDSDDSTVHEVEELEFVSDQSFHCSSDMLHPKRRRTSNSDFPEKYREPEKHSVSQSQQSSPSQSDQGPTPVKKNTGSSYPFSGAHPTLFRQSISNASCYHQANPIHAISTACPDVCLSLEHPNQIKQQHRNTVFNDVCQSMIGAEVRGQLDGAFDSGYLMTATVNGKVFRGVLFAPGPDVASRGQNQAMMGYPRHHHHHVKVINGHISETSRSSPERRSSLPLRRVNSRSNSELQGVILTLASPGSDHGRI